METIDDLCVQLLIDTSEKNLSEIHFNNGKQCKENGAGKYESVRKWKMNEHTKLVDVYFKANYTHAEKTR